MELLDARRARDRRSRSSTPRWQRASRSAACRCALQLDRVDRLADGSLAVIDYKTGANAAPAGMDG